MLKVSKLIGILLTAVLFQSCNYYTKDYSNLDAFNEHGKLQVVIENPIGSTSEVNFCSIENEFLQHGNLDKAFPANNGFIPSTHLDFNISKVAGPIDVFVVGKPIEQGHTLTVKPLGVLKYKIENILTYKIVAVPTSAELLSYPINDFGEFSEDFVDLRKQLSDWTLQKNKIENTVLLGWYDEDEAVSIIKQHMLRS